MAYSFEQVFAADPANPANIAQNASITIFAPGDGTMTPIAITDPDGQALANPIPVNANGFGSAFMADIDRVAWLGGGFTGFFTSYEGMKNEAVAAREAAETAGADAAAAASDSLAAAVADAATAAASAESASTSASSSAESAANAAALVGAPADTAIAAAINGAGSTRTALDTTYARRTGSTLVTLGDSLTAQALAATGAVAANDTTHKVANPRGWQTWAFAALGQKVNWVFNAGVGGDTTTMMLARMSADVYAHNPDIVTVWAGRNDIFFTSDTAAVIMGRIQQIVEGCLTSGVRLVPLFTVTASGTDTTTQKATRRTLNGLIRAYARSTPGVVLVDTAPSWVDPATEVNITEAVNGDLISSDPNVYDTTHASATGATRIAKIFVDAVGPLIGGSPRRGELVSDYISANPMLTGTTGGRDTGMTGTVPVTWIAWAHTGGVAAAFSQVPRTDGIVGDWTEINITTAGTIRFQHNGYATGFGTAWNPGDSFFLEIEYEIDPSLVGLTQLWGQSNIGGTAVKDAWVGRSDLTNDVLTTKAVMPTKGILRSPVQKFAAGATTLGVAVYIAATSGKIRLGRIGLRKV